MARRAGDICLGHSMWNRGRFARDRFESKNNNNPLYWRPRCKRFRLAEVTALSKAVTAAEEGRHSWAERFFALAVRLESKRIQMREARWHSEREKEYAFHWPDSV